MRSFRPSRRVWAIAGAFTTLLAICLIAPAPARAGCGHTSERPGIGLGVDQLDGSLKATDQAPPPKPCSGLSCSGNPAPQPTSAPKSPPRVEIWGLAAESPPLDPPDPTDWDLEDARERPILLATSLFHPPRSPR